ncbi:MAG: class I SAM-dependent methyltransferase [bacterium]|nr:class I SAM-dependent methyltransferase [bacterium]
MGIDDRLLTVAGLVPKNAKVADIGTDHAYLPIYLRSNNIASKVIACDISPGPLAVAEKNIVKSGICGVTTRLCNGLDGVDSSEVDTVVIAGMGGEMITQIIARADWLRSDTYSLILQPMSSAVELRQFLCDNGFAVETECAVFSNRRIYSVMKVFYSGEVLQADPVFLYLGKLLDNITEQALIYIKRQKKLISQRVKMLETVKRKRAEYLTLCEVLNEIDKILLRNDGSCR